jgi:hypothetical protein
MTQNNQVAVDNRQCYQTGFASWQVAMPGPSSWIFAQAHVDLATMAMGGPTLSQTLLAAEIASDFIHTANMAQIYYDEILMPIAVPRSAFDEAVISWNATTPADTWVEVQLRVNHAGAWSNWHSFGLWNSGNGPFQRHSLSQGKDSMGEVQVDTFYAKARVERYQLRVRRYSTSRLIAPCIQHVSIAYSSFPPRPALISTGDHACWNTLLAVPPHSQMQYPINGRFWCSPVSLAMVIAYWQGRQPTAPDIARAVEGVYDADYDGHGNWAFNAAFAPQAGLEGYILRLPSLAAAEQWIAADIPLIITYQWRDGELTGAAIPESPGHLVVLVGFDAKGNPIVNDPAAIEDGAVRRTYARHEIERLWLESSGGTCYVIAPNRKSLLHKHRSIETGGS